MTIRRTWNMTALLGVFVLSPAAWAQWESGSDGSDGAFSPAVDSSRAATAMAESPAIQRMTIDGGGQMRSTDGVFELSGTIGQPDAGRSAGGFFALTGGFWVELVAGDGNEDGVITLLDLDAFVACIGGPCVASTALCHGLDANTDGFIDLRDFAELQSSFSSP